MPADGIVVSGKEILLSPAESIQFFRLNVYPVLLVISMYSLPGNETSGMGSAMISEITTSPVMAHKGVKPVCIF